MRNRIESVFHFYFPFHFYPSMCQLATKQNNVSKLCLSAVSKHDVISSILCEILPWQTFCDIQKKNKKKKKKKTLDRKLATVYVMTEKRL